MLYRWAEVEGSPHLACSSRSRSPVGPAAATVDLEAGLSAEGKDRGTATLQHP